MPFSPGKMLILAGVALIAAGLLISGTSWFGRLPGDFVIKRENFSFYFPLTTSILVSVVISLIIRFFK